MQSAMMPLANPPIPDRNRTTPPAPVALLPVPSTKRIKTSFISAGLRCAATLHLPQNAGDRPLPAILMVHGWGGVQDLFTPPFYNAFTRAGFAVMTFDYASWGKSEGKPRNVIDPWRRVGNAEDALAHLKRMPQIDRRLVFLWGTSFGGGHVIDLATRHPELLGAIAQMPLLDGFAAMTETSLLRALRMSAYVLADLVFWDGPVYVPTVSPCGKLGTLDSDGAYETFTRFLRGSGQRYNNRVAARSVLKLAGYRPWKRLKDVRIPTLLIGASRDSVVPFGEDAIRNAGNPMLKMRLLDANHFEPYVEPVFSVNIAYQLEFLNTRLPARTNAA
jgi:uncharacterized protein